MKIEKKLLTIILCLIIVLSYFAWIRPNVSNAWDRFYATDLAASNVTIDEGKLTGLDLAFNLKVDFMKVYQLIVMEILQLREK